MSMSDIARWHAPQGWPMSSRPGPTPCRLRQSQLLCAATVWIRFNWECNSQRPHQLMAAYVHDSQFFTRRTIVLFAIVGLHVFIAWALATGLARRAIELVAPPLQTTVVEEVVKRDEPPPPPPPQMERPPVEVPPPDVNIELPAEPTSTAIVDTTDKPVVKAPPPAPTHNVVR